MNPKYFEITSHYNASFTEPIIPRPMTEIERTNIADAFAKDPVFKMHPEEGEWVKASNGSAIFVPKEILSAEVYLIKEAA